MYVCIMKTLGDMELNSIRISRKCSSASLGKKIQLTNIFSSQNDDNRHVKYHI